jgi:DNA-binding HxlR family transcriptional regulator
MTNASYKQFCPVAMAAEILCTRWTVVLLRELLAGSTRFNELRRGIPRLSPALLSQRLKDLEGAGVVIRKAGRGEASEYLLTDAGQQLRPLIEAFGAWGQRWIDTDVSLQNLDVSLLMWDMRRRLNPRPIGPRRAVIQFRYSDLPAARRSWWLVIDPKGGADLCSVDPGHEVDLYVATDLRTMTAIWMGLETVRKASGDRRLILTGDRKLAAEIQNWLGLSFFAGKRAA